MLLCKCPHAHHVIENVFKQLGKFNFALGKKSLVLKKKD